LITPCGYQLQFGGRKIEGKHRCDGPAHGRKVVGGEGFHPNNPPADYLDK